MSSPSASQLQINIKCANKREGDSLYNSGYVDYTISTVCNHPAFPAGYFTVDRRFSDFVWLREELGKTYPAIIIPSLPEKQVIGIGIKIQTPRNPYNPCNTIPCLISRSF